MATLSKIFPYNSLHFLQQKQDTDILPWRWKKNRNLEKKTPQQTHETISTRIRSVPLTPLITLAKENIENNRILFILFRRGNSLETR